MNEPVLKAERLAKRFTEGGLDVPVLQGMNFGVEPGRRRRVVSVRDLGDDIVHAPRAWRTSPELEGLAAQLAPGAPMVHPLFPLIEPADDAR